MPTQIFTYHKTSLVPFAVLFSLLLPPTQSRAQSLQQRFFMSWHASVNTAKYIGPASFSLSAEPKVWITNHFYAGLKCDVAVGTFGGNDERTFFSHLDPVMGSVSSLMLNGYFEERIGYANFFVGLGIGKFFTKDIFGQNTNFPASGIAMDTLRMHPSWGRSFVLGAKGQHGYLSVSFKKSYGKNNYLKVPNFMSTTVGMEFGNGKYLTKYRRVNEYELPPLMIEVGQQLAVPVDRQPGAVGRTVYADIKVSFRGKFSIGARLLDLPREGYGADRDGYPTGNQPLPTSSSFYDFGRINTMRLVHSNTLFVDYYFQRENSWIYMGIGGGWYRFDGLETLDFSPAFKLEGIPSADRAGVVLRLGHKVGFFRSGLDFNLTGSGVPNYASLRLGIEPGLFFYRDKSND